MLLLHHLRFCYFYGVYHMYIGYQTFKLTFFLGGGDGAGGGDTEHYHEEE